MKSMKKIFSIVCALVFSLQLAALPAQSEETTLLLSESFNRYVTNEKPSALNVSGRYWRVAEYKIKDKGLEILTTNSPSTAVFSFASAQKLCASFDIKCIDNAVNGELFIKNSSGEFKLLSFDNRNEIKTYDGKHFAGYNSSQMRRIGVCIDLEWKTMDIYVDGTLRYDDYRLFGLGLKNVSEMKFTFSSDAAGEGVILDNINVNTGDKPFTDYSESEYNPESVEYQEPVFEAKVGSRVIMNADFEDSAPFILRNKTNTLENRSENEDNKALYFERMTTDDMHADSNSMSSTSDCIVFEWDIKLLDSNSTFYFTIFDKNGAGLEAAYLGKNGALSMLGKSVKLSLDTWHSAAFAINLYDRVCNLYFDGKMIAENVSLGNTFASSVGINFMRFHTRGTSDAISGSAKYMIDNCRVYEGKEPRKDLGEMEVYLPETTVYGNDSAYKAIMQGYTGIHRRSGVVTVNGEKHLLPTRPYKKDGATMVSLSELGEALGISVVRNGDEYNVNGSIVLKAGQNTLIKGSETAALSTNAIEGKDDLHIPLEDFIEIGLDKKVYTDDTTLNSGMLIFGDTGFEPPAGSDGIRYIDLPQENSGVWTGIDRSSDLQKLNNYLMWYTPDAKTLEEKYKQSELYGVHPRLHASAADFDRIRREIETDVIKKNWAKKLIDSADRLLGTEPVKYELRDGVRLLYVSRDVLSHVYTLGMAYQLTGEQKYADRAYLDLEAVSKFSDWHPSHHLDVGEMAAAVAIGYDWMYHAFSEEQRKVIEKGIYQNAFYDYMLAIESRDTAMGEAMYLTGNHNNVMSSGAALAALAMMDVYPEESAFLLQYAIKNISRTISSFAPEGAYYEGPHYWELMMQYTAKMFASLETVFGSCFALDYAQGLDENGEWLLHMSTPTAGIFNFSDADAAKLYVPELFWLSNHFNNSGLTYSVLKATNNEMKNNEDMALSLLWCNTDAKLAENEMPLDRAYVDSTLLMRDDTVTMRSSWKEENPTYVGLHGGVTYHSADHSQLDAGSFVFDSMGVRWAKDLGYGAINHPLFWDSWTGGTRWSLYRNRAESHNTIVVNPSEEPDQEPDSYAPVTRFETKPRGALAEMDLTDAYRDEVISAKRGIYLTDNRTSLVTRDEVTVGKESDVYWFMTTEADVTVNGNEAVLSQSGKKLRLEFVSNAAAELSVNTAGPLPESPHIENDMKETAKRIAIHAKGSGNISITVKLTPYFAEGSPVSEYDKPISEWSVPDGEILRKPTLEGVTIGGEYYSFADNQTYLDYLAIDGKVAEVSAQSETYDVSVVQTDDINEATKIYVSDKNNPENTAVYYVLYHSIKSPYAPEGKKAINVRGLSVSDEPQPANNALNLLDGSLDTRWSSDGAEQWILLDLNSVQRVDEIAISFFAGAERQTRFYLSVSEDGVNYEEVHRGLSSGTTSDYELYSLEGRQVRYVRIGLNGNTTAEVGWSSISEVSVLQNK